MDGIIGNSSSGILEAPSLKIPTLNIGGRQDGRLRAKSILDCSYNKEEIKLNIKKILKFKNNKSVFNNPYDHGDSIKKIIGKIKTLKKNNISKKNKAFFDLNI